MNKRYVIRWKSKVNGRAGRGSKVFERDEAERLVAELNQEYPEIEHELADAETDPRLTQPVPETPQAQSESESRPAPENPTHAFSE